MNKEIPRETRVIKKVPIDVPEKPQEQAPEGSACTVAKLKGELFIVSRPKALRKTAKEIERNIPMRPSQTELNFRK